MRPLFPHVHRPLRPTRRARRYHRSGLYQRELPFVLGQEAAGEIMAVSPEAAEAGWSEGDRVAYTTLQTYAEVSAVPAGALLAVPPGLSLEQACAAVVQGLTAHYLVTDAHAGIARPGDWMLIQAVAGGTGQLAAQMAKVQRPPLWRGLALGAKPRPACTGAWVQGARRLFDSKGSARG